MKYKIFIFLMFIFLILFINLWYLFAKDNISKDNILKVFYIDTKGSKRYYRVIYDKSNYYITGYQLDHLSMKYAIVKLNSDLTLNYAKYYIPDNLDKFINLGLTNLWFNFNNNEELFTGG
jgi:hypothetical protein